ncbi:hypothetical protein PV721_32375 [Streptomyces sp. MB09-01]|uniref:hypothetical protein n=1 Tax=Streptomyces sp. MB09-01 TaxID=3028666 RepID=UPI0029AA252D|nr:hypothetical protein [Streptomyces sp. MB09-01]MDX3538953.1 hypothetical protein [Streptomyces sp. MB09-01]
MAKPRPGRPTELTADLLDECLQAAGESYEAGELAFLALGTQIENPIRDRVAFELHRRLRRTGLDVGREWTGMDTEGEGGRRAARRVDLAVVKRSARYSRRDKAMDTRGVVEFKSARTFKAQSASGLSTVYKQVTDDIAKCVTWIGLMVEPIFAVVLLPHGEIVDDEMTADHVTKDYWEMWKAGQPVRSDAVREQAAAGVADRLAPLGPVRRGVIDGGVEFGTHVTVPYVILGPVSNDTMMALLNKWPLPAVPAQ